MNALVMYDRQTGTLWSQFLGQAVSGVLAGQLLEPVPLITTTWGRWVEEHPDTIALDKGRGSYTRDSYESYYANNRVTGVIGQAHSDNRLDNKDLVLGVGFDDGPIAYPFDALAIERVVNDKITGRPSVIYFDDTADTAFAYRAEIDGRTLTFSIGREGDRDVLVDAETGSRWIPFTGTAFDGELAGRNLERIHSTASFWFAWTDFYPDTALFQAG
jgi:hypothetical protein